MPSGGKASMEAFLNLKKRKHSSNSSPRRAPKPPPPDKWEGKSTDVKLNALGSLHPYIKDQDMLLDILLAHDGSVSAASASLKMSKFATQPSGSPVVVGAQSSLRSFAIAPGSNSITWPNPKRPKLVAKKGTTLHLFDPADIEEQTPCSVIYNFLPSELANALLRELLEESKTFEKITFKLFENVVASPHTSAFFVDDLEAVNRQKSEYLYNGGRLTDVRQLTPNLAAVKPLVQEKVNTEIHRRIQQHHNGKKLNHQCPDTWTPNAAMVNCYNGPQQSVGWHSDTMTYLGPRAIIGSLSLGVAREFRVRRILPSATTKDKEKDAGPGGEGEKEDPDADAAGQISIHLPHNSLLVMHAEMQEAWKHTLSPAPAIDPHPIAGNKRINVTYRWYRPSFHPRLTPRCECRVGCVLRVVQRKRENWGRYFWMCYGGNVPGKEGCAFFRWAVFDGDGNPEWDEGRFGKGEGVKGAKGVEEGEDKVD